MINLLIFKDLRIDEVKVFLCVCCFKEWIALAFHLISYHIIELSLQSSSVNTLLAIKLNAEICQ